MKSATHFQIIDGVGAHSGMQAYNVSLATALLSGGWRVSIYSNFLDARFGNALGWVLPNFYVGSLLTNVRRMFRCGLDVYRYVRRTDDDATWWLLHFHGGTLGNLIFFMALVLATDRRRVGLIVHDVTSVHKRENPFFRWVKRLFYRHAPHLAVVHSSMAGEQLRQLGFDGAMVHVEHFRASDADVPPLAHIEDPVLRAVLEGPRRRVLLFGSIRATKGLDTALAALRALPADIRGALTLVVAGRDSGGVLGSPGHVIPDDGSVVVLDRFISNEERAALFKATDLVILPYRSIYQSGVLDFAVYYRKPVLASSLPPFQAFFDQFPSFGQVYGQHPDELAASLLAWLTQTPAPRATYTTDDLARYEATDPSLTFARDLRAVIAGMG